MNAVVQPLAPAGHPTAERGTSAGREFGLLVIVLIVLVWQFQQLVDSAGQAAAEDRYRLDAALQTAPLIGFGNARLATLCHQISLPPRLQWRWATACQATEPDEARDARGAGGVEEFTNALADDLAALQRAIAQGASERMASVAPLARSLGEGVLAPEDQARLANTTRGLTEYRARYRLGPDPAAGSATLSCAWAQMQHLASRAGAEPERNTVLANQLALVRGEPGRLWWPASGPADGAGWAPAIAGRCGELGAPRQVIAEAAGLARRVRDGQMLADKAAAMQRLLARAPWLLVGWSLLSWGLLSLARRTRRPVRFVPLALWAWAAAGAASGLAQPDSGAELPWWLWVGLAGAGVVVALLSRSAWVERLTLLAPCPAQRAVSAWALPMFVLFVGIGWWLLIDLGLNGHFQTRYIALRHGLAVFVSMALLSVLPVFAHGLATLWLSAASLITNALRQGRGGRVPAWARPALLGLLYAGLVLAAALLTPGWRQLTGEVLPLWLLLGVAWFFTLRAARWTQPAGSGWRSLGASMLPLLVHVAVVLAALAVTDDLGPMLVVLCASAIFSGAFAAQALLARGAGWPGAALAGTLAAVLLAGVLLGGLTLFAQLPGAAAQRVADRLDSVIDPFSAENDQLARVLWLREHTPEHGYGLGAVPWCGTLPGDGCPGVPRQMQSDYTFAAVHAVLGTVGSFVLLAVFLLWLAWLAVRQAANTPGTLALSTPGAAQAAWLAWLGVCWAVLTIVQTVVTVAGNLGALPLTGVTWPFVSYGLWSLLRNTLILGLVMHRPHDEAGMAHSFSTTQR